MIKMIMIMNMMMELIIIGVDGDDENEDRMMIIMMIMMIKTMMTKMIMIEKIADVEITLEDLFSRTSEKLRNCDLPHKKSYQSASFRIFQKSKFGSISLTRFPIHS